MPDDPIRLLDLEPQFLRRVDDTHWEHVDGLGQADGIIFLCPKCWVAHGRTRPGVHSVVCWRPRVPQTTRPTPGRWEFSGTGFADLSLVAGSSSVRLDGGCAWHGFVTGGIVTILPG